MKPSHMELDIMVSNTGFVQMFIKHCLTGKSLSNVVWSNLRSKVLVYVLMAQIS